MFAGYKFLPLENCCQPSFLGSIVLGVWVKVDICSVSGREFSLILSSINSCKIPFLVSSMRSG